MLKKRYNPKPSSLIIVELPDGTEAHVPSTWQAKDMLREGTAVKAWIQYLKPDGRRGTAIEIKVNT